MSPSLLWRPALLAVVGCGVWASLASAQEQPQQEQPHPWHYPGNHTFAPPGAPPVDNTQVHSLHERFRTGRPLACWSSFNGYTCGSLRAECDFIFGSCRTFFGEPCLKGPPPSPLPPWVRLTPPSSPSAPGGAGHVLPTECNCR